MFSYPWFALKGLHPGFRRSLFQSYKESESLLSFVDFKLSFTLISAKLNFKMASVPPT
jgi:hypothetical protein